MNRYLLLLHESSTGFSDISPEEIQGIVNEYKAWSDKMGQAGHLVMGEKLQDGSGRNLRQGDAGLVVDGPFSETKEVVGGLFLIESRDYDHAVELCSDCPHLKYGGRIEIREIEATH